MDKNQGFPSCRCGCNQRVRKVGNIYIYGHNSRGKDNPMYGTPGGMYGKHLSLEARKKISEANGRRHPSKETKEKLRLSHIGKKHSEESKNKMSLAQKNKKFSIETRKRLSLAATGKHPSDKTRQVLREKRLQRILPTKDTKIERMLQDELSLRGYGYYPHYPVIGQPDIAFPDQKIAIFCDGDAVHGNPNTYSPMDKLPYHKHAQEKWDSDKRVTETLCAQGWLVLRYWEYEIKANIEAVVDEIEDRLFT